MSVTRKKKNVKRKRKTAREGRGKEGIMQDIKYSSRKAELHSAIVILRGVLSYHERMCGVDDVLPGYEKCPLDLKDSYRQALKTAIEALKDLESLER